MLVISCHADTGFRAHSLHRMDDGTVYGHLDNFAGVWSVMKAYFSGRLNQGYVRIELTHGEETDLAGARAVSATLEPSDVVLVIDVTGAPTEGDFTIEKCRSQKLRDFLQDTLAGMRFDLYEGCPDPIASTDESDIYRETCELVFFLGVPCFGGDYNAGPVHCREQSLDAIAEAICRVAEAYPHLARR